MRKVCFLELLPRATRAIRARGAKPQPNESGLNQRNRGKRAKSAAVDTSSA